ncbi:MULTISPECIES: membrane protein YpdK [Erwinia]|nr:membrane protein YpdK [Erwinia aphidicola]
MGVQRVFAVKYAFMGISFILLIWVGTFYLML